MAAPAFCEWGGAKAFVRKATFTCLTSTIIVLSMGYYVIVIG